jgi:hypothetical protein
MWHSAFEVVYRKLVQEAHVAQSVFLDYVVLAVVLSYITDNASYHPNPRSLVSLMIQEVL